jgi:hypothetical protein
LAVAGSVAEAQETCGQSDREVCIRFLPINNPKYAHWQLLPTRLFRSRFNLREGSRQREIRPGFKSYFPRTGTISIQRCTLTVVNTAASCGPWVAFRAPQWQTDRFDRRVVIVNGTNGVVDRFYATPVGVGNWGRDRLGNRVLRPRQTLTIDFDDGARSCLFDFRAVLAGGRAVEARRVDVCSISTWTVR